MATITSVTRTVDSNGRVWFRTEVAPGYPEPAMPAYSQDANRAYAPDSELAELARALRA